MFFHCATGGIKLDLLRTNNKICFEVDMDHVLVASENACRWGMQGRSVVGFGKAYILGDADSKKEGLDVIMEHYGATAPFSYKEEVLKRTLIIKVTIDRMTGKVVG